jgi:cytosine/adenosine deaminase-related metal-dependent hydrolase
MQKIISANWIYPVDADPIENGALVIDTDGTILKVLTAAEAEGLENIVHYNGILVPGFVNTHCHLELSHMKGLIEEKTGLPNFIKEILAQRQQPTEDILVAMKRADEEMYHNGIVAVGDISNLLLSKSVKEQSKIYYHTFIEVFGFNRPSEPVIEIGKQLKNDFLPLKASVVPHAPYSVSSSLFNEIVNVTKDDDVSSIHNQETMGETELFETGTGAFADFFADLGIAQSEAHNKGRNSLQYHLPQLAKNVNTLLVHNTFSSKADINFAKEQHQKLFWCLCPNANIYIENNLPDVDLFIKEGMNVTLGTDSLASNHQLNILAEMQTLQQRKNVAFNELLKWATLNGALFLGIDSQYGSLTVGKKPGILHINIADNARITNETKIKRLF